VPRSREELYLHSPTCLQQLSLPLTSEEEYHLNEETEVYPFNLEGK
jgi:hypothetical protein